MKKITFILITMSIMIPSMSLAHPGRTDSSGCHTCKTNCPNWGLSSGEYHCHNAKALPQPLAPVKSTHGENGTGYVSPAPEYSAPKTQIKKEVVTPSADIIMPVISPTQSKPVEKNWFKSLFSWLF